jgi:hypothetical protein
MARSNRWDYMADPRHNPPNDDCPECSEPSKTHHLGAKTVFRDDGTSYAVTRWECANNHTWKTTEERT